MSNQMPDRAGMSRNWRVKDEAPSSSPIPLYGGFSWRDGRLGQVQENGEQSRTHSNDELAKQAIAEGRSIYVGNMPFAAKQTDVEALFEGGRYRVARIAFLRDPATEQSRGYCFVELETKEHAETAMKMLDGIDFLGRRLKVKSKVDTSRVYGNGEGFFNATFRGNNDLLGPRLYVGGLRNILDQGEFEGEMRNMFVGFQLVSIGALRSHPSRDDESVPFYYCFVDMSTAEEAERARANLDGTPAPWGNNLHVKKAKERAVD